MAPSFEALVTKSKELGASDAKLINVADIVLDPRAALKCRFGCSRWGRFWTCPPNIHISEKEFHNALSKYTTAIIIKSDNPKIGQDVSLAIEKQAMLEHGAMFAFALVLCVMCDECAYPEPCRFPHLARPSMDSLGVDIGKTIEPLGFQVEFDSKGSLLPAWYTMVLLD